MTADHDIDATNQQPATGNVLRIVSGLHAGAARSLEEQEMILVGSGDDCDIVLADAGVASHHALISLLNGRFSLRALDAPVHVGTSMVHPGDPVELASVQRVGLGDAALAFGREDDPSWEVVMPGIAAARPSPARVATPYLRRLPAIAAVAALSLASLAIFVAVMPDPPPPPDPSADLKALIPQYAIEDGRAEVNTGGDLVLTGTVRDSATRERIARDIATKGIPAKLELRTGDDIAGDVSEVLRSRSMALRTRYLGDGDVEVSGSFDEDALLAIVQSRAMADVTGLNRVIPLNTTPSSDVAETGEAAPAEPPRIRVAGIVRGTDPHVVAEGGEKYPVGSDLPGLGTLISIDPDSAHVLAADGSLQRLRIDPRKPADGPAAAPPGAFSKVRSKASPIRM